jgi:hypothetical protein
MTENQEHEIRAVAHADAINEVVIAQLRQIVHLRGELAVANQRAFAFESELKKLQGEL